MEYGLHEEFHSYAGGLGVLAGDFMKSAGDLGLPVVGDRAPLGAGLYRAAHRPRRLPLRQWRDSPPDLPRDTGVRVRVRVAAREVECCVWQRRALRHRAALPDRAGGRAGPLDHPPPLRPRARLPASPRRCCSGIGGVRALRALHLPVDLYHFNEGHAVFAGIELIADRMEAGADFRAGVAGGAREASSSPPTRRCPRATRSTPLERSAPSRGGLRARGQAELREIGGDPFNMTVAGLRLARARQRRGPAPRRDGARDVGECRRRRAHHRHHQRRPSRDVAGPAHRRRRGRRRRRPSLGAPGDEGRAPRRGRGANGGQARAGRPSPSASRGARRPTSAPTSCCAIRTASPLS